MQLDLVRLHLSKGKTMNILSNPLFDVSPEVSEALASKKPIVSLESSAITHGIPYPLNIKTFNSMKAIIRENGIVPALIGIYQGKIKVVFSESDIEFMVNNVESHKINSGEIAWALSNHLYGGTTISATTYISKLAGIQFFISGGIGGVHLGEHIDISSDLRELSTNRIMVICSGVKAILSVLDTMEILETLSVPVIGYQTNKMPGFIIRDTGIQLKNVANDFKVVVDQYKIHQSLERPSAFIVVIPPPEKDAIPLQKFNLALENANLKAKNESISGPELTPFLLNQINKEFSGSMFSAITSMLINNVSLGCQIVKEYYQSD